MARSAFLSTSVLVGIATLFQFLGPSALASDKFQVEKRRFVQLEVGNQRARNVCLGLAGAIACLEEASETEGESDVGVLTERIWKQLHDPGYKFDYSQFVLLDDGRRVRTCSEAAISELAVLLQTKYEDFVNNEVWQTGVEPDPTTGAGRALLEKRRKYEACYQTKITSRLALKSLIEHDKDGLVALAGSGVRHFQNRPPQQLIDKYKLMIDPRTRTYPAVPSNHAFLITYDKENDSFYVYDSDDPDRKWPARVRGSGDRFTIDWHIDDHMGNGPSRQVYFDLKPLSELLVYVKRIVEEKNVTR